MASPENAVVFAVTSSSQVDQPRCALLKPSLCTLNLNLLNTYVLHCHFFNSARQLIKQIVLIFVLVAGVSRCKDGLRNSDRNKKSARKQ